MIEGLKPYTDYKESGLPWLDNFPAHWSTRRMKVLFKERVEKGFPHEPLLAATQTKGVVRKEDYGERTVTASKDFHLLKLVELDDFVISLRSFQGGIEYSRCRGIISPAYTVLTPRPGTTRGYYSYFLKSKPFVDSLTLFVTGIREGQNIEYPRLARAYMPLPPPDEQAAIVRFLDYANGKIERAIRAKRKLIGLLNEQKQAIIHRAVTRGLDPTVKLKSSGVPWLGDVPEHWEVRKIKSLVKTFGGMTPSKGNERFWNGSIPWVSPKDMKSREIVDSIDHITEKAICETNITLIEPPAVLIVVRGMILARTFPTAITKVPVTINQDMKALVTCPEVNSDYFVSILSGIQGDLLALVEIAGHGTCCLRTDSWGNFLLPIPPLKEQEKITEMLQSELSFVTSVTTQTEREINLLREYRTTLTTEVVTGKLDVREAVKRLPDQADEPLPADESLDDLDDEITEEVEA
jgi:type I restriction enzyme S subunit